MIWHIREPELSKKEAVIIRSSIETHTLSRIKERFRHMMAQCLETTEDIEGNIKE
jgi:hypothetical protein